MASKKRDFSEYRVSPDSKNVMNSSHEAATAVENGKKQRVGDMLSTETANVSTPAPSNAETGWKWNATKGKFLPQHKLQVRKLTDEGETQQVRQLFKTDLNESQKTNGYVDIHAPDSQYSADVSQN